MAETDTPHARLAFKLADTRERDVALAYRAEIYQRELGGHGVDAFDEVAHHLIVVDPAGQILSALRVIPPSVRPLEIESYVQLSRFIEAERVPAQIGGFWIRPDQRRITSKSLLHLRMMKFALEFSQTLGVTDFASYTVRQLKTFYGRVGFRPGQPETFVHPGWGEVCLLHLDILALDRLVADGSFSWLARLGPTT